MWVLTTQRFDDMALVFHGDTPARQWSVCDFILTFGDAMPWTVDALHEVPASVLDVLLDALTWGVEYEMWIGPCAAGFEWVEHWEAA